MPPREWSCQRFEPRAVIEETLQSMRATVDARTKVEKRGEWG